MSEFNELYVIQDGDIFVQGEPMSIEQIAHELNALYNSFHWCLSNSIELVEACDGLLAEVQGNPDLKETEFFQKFLWDSGVATVKQIVLSCQTGIESFDNPEVMKALRSAEGNGLLEAAFPDLVVEDELQGTEDTSAE